MAERDPGAPLPARPDEALKPAAGPPGDPYTAMTPRFGRLARVFGERFFSGFRFENGDVDRIRTIEQRGAVVYVMRYSSRLDYFLFNWLLLRERLRLSAYANGIRFYYYRPIGEALRLLVRGLSQRLRRGAAAMRQQNLQALQQALIGGQTLFLFLRTDKIRSRLSATRLGALRSGRSELDFLREVVQRTAEEGLAVNLIPLALFWRKGARTQRRFLNLFYGAPERPTDTGKVLSFLWNYRNLAVRVGTPIDLGSFVAETRDEPLERVVTKVRRTLLIFLRREERPVAGAALLPLYRIEELVLGDSEVRAVIADVARASNKPLERIEARARRQLKEIAANPSPSMLAVLDVIVARIFGRLFDRVEVHGLDRIVEAAKQNPLVLVPSHRSHFDYLLLSWLFYERHLVPPLVAAGVNLAFWPLGPIFRRAGGFFLRRSFEGDALYTAVFRRYVQQLIKDGVTQEFFIEGTRSRTGKTLPPRLGMLGMVLEAWARGVRRDVYLVPIGFAYERLVEEGAITDERRGARKTRESLASLLRARGVLRQRFGSVVVRFGEPLLLSEYVGPERGLLAGDVAPAETRGPEGIRAERRALVERVGFEVCRRINAEVTAVRSALAGAALLATPTRGVLRDEFVARARAFADLLEALGVPLSDSLAADLRRGDLDTALELLERSGVIQRQRERSYDLISFEESNRDILDYYRSTIAHALALGGAVALAQSLETSRAGLLREASDWLDLLRFEFLPPEEPERALRLARVLDLYLARGWLEEHEGQLRRTEEGQQILPLFAAQIRPPLEVYGGVLEVVLETGGQGERRTLERDALAAIRRHLLVGEAAFAESAAPAALGNAVRWLRSEGILAPGSSRADARLEPGPRFADLKGWRTRIARAATTR